MTAIQHRIEPQSGAGFELRAGELLRVVDPRGEQVSDLIAFARDDRAEWLSSGRTLDYNNTIYLTTGHTLYSNRSRPMFRIVADTVGRHDFLYTPCSRETFTLIYRNHEYHPSCFENLARELKPFGIAPDQIPTTFNIFMNVRVLGAAHLKIDPPLSRRGDSLERGAERDRVVAPPACSAEMSNNSRFKP